jgi:hypothetical protein
LGTSPFLIDALKMEQTGWLKLTAQLFSSQFGISSGPVALRSLMQDRRASTASGEIMYKSGIQVTGWHINFLKSLCGGERNSEMNITGMLSPTRNLKPNLKASSSLHWIHVFLKTDSR